jgi:hypothetical protein
MLDNCLRSEWRCPVQRDDGQWQLGIADDAVGPFPSRAFAAAVAGRAA